MSPVCPVCNNPVHDTDASCPACGFKLLGSTQQFEPIVVGQDSAQGSHKAKEVQSASLTIVRGPQIGTTYALDDKVQTIGRDPQCDIFLNDMTVSRSHAQISPSGSGFAISDLSSYNGIWINNENVDSARLYDGDIIQIGTFCLIYEQ